MYVDRDYAESRLTGTLVRWNGKAVAVCCVRDDMSCEVKDVLQGTYSEVHIDDLDLQSPPLGFVNIDRGVQYLVRRPMRADWRQGVRTNSVINQLTRGSRPTTDLIAECINGSYPKKSIALRRLREGVRGVAISREFSLTRKGSRTIINYKWYGPIGELTSKGAVLDEKWQYLMPRIKGVV